MRRKCRASQKEEVFTWNTLSKIERMNFRFKIVKPHLIDINTNLLPRHPYLLWISSSTRDYVTDIVESESLLNLSLWRDRKTNLCLQWNILCSSKIKFISLIYGVLVKYKGCLENDVCTSPFRNIWLFLVCCLWNWILSVKMKNWLSCGFSSMFCVSLLSL